MCKYAENIEAARAITIGTCIVEKSTNRVVYFKTADGWWTLPNNPTMFTPTQSPYHNDLWIRETILNGTDDAFFLCRPNA